MLKIESHILLALYETNTWLLWDDVSHMALLIDPAAPSDKLLRRIHDLGLNVVSIVNTHGHGDHIGGNGFFRDKLNTQLAIHPADASMLGDNKKNMSEYMGTPLPGLSADRLLEDGDTFKLGDHIVTVIHTPGHTPGCICLLCEKYLISGDTLFEMSIGRTDFPGGSHAAIVDSIRDKLFILPDDVVVFPGHGPTTAIGLEKKNNPFVS
jgi:glyoxylase-like metal-dependent hydrolase (beta-lactamase superfamily II)